MIIVSCCLVAVQKVTCSCSTCSGSGAGGFKLSFGGQLTQEIAVDASTAAVVSALEVG
jgi:hypothetical protein